MRRYKIANKEVVDSLERDKVDKVPGKGLSEHDFNTFYKQKVDGFESYVDGKVKTDVPADAKFTDTDTTYSEITTAEIDAGTASTLRTITARRIKYILDKVKGWISSLTKSDVGLGDVDNTSDLAKPISTATQTALNNKVDNSRVLTNVPVDAEFTDTVYTHPSSHPASMIGESSTKRFVSDTEKTSWSAKQNALGFTPENTINKGKSGGYAELDANIKIPLSQLPDIAKQQTYVVTNASERDLLKGLIVGEKCYLTSTGDSYIWDGISWLTLSKADWENINLQWSNIAGKPASTVTNLDDAVNKRHVHVNKDIIDGISQTNIDSWSGKAEVSQIPTKNSQLVNDSNYVTSAELGSAGYGDMNKSTYDTNNSGKVDIADVAESIKWSGITGKPSTFSPIAHSHSIENISNLQAELNLKADKSQVLKNVPADAEFTDTIYTHPSTHSASIINEEVDKRFLTDAERVKLNAIEAGANNYVHPANHPVTIITETSAKQFVSDTEKANWNSVNNKVNKVTGKGLSTEDYTAVEKSKLGGIETGANKYIHPSSHPADMIVETTSKRFTSDTEKSSWNAKQDALGFTPENPTNKGKSGGYAELDANAKIPLSQLPDITKQQTYVVTNIGERDLLAGLIMGEKCYLTSTGDSYIWNGTSWLTLSKADWENVNLQWSSIVGKPASPITNIDDAVDKRHTHENKAVVDSISQANINSWSEKAEVSQIPTKNSQLTNDSNYVTSSELESAGYGDMTKATYDTNNNGKVDIADVAESVAWSGITGKPSTFSPIAHSHSIENISNLQAELNLKTDKSQVLKNVPADAKFTDTVYNHPDTHPYSMITGTPTSLPADGGNADTVNGKTVLSNVPADAIFTDTTDHTHTNTSTLDKFTEVDNKPYYNGEEIGGAVPNLTLNELTLGGRFKISYNDIEDSLDIEVI